VEPYDNSQNSLPDRIGKYDILAKLGSGGMGVVYRGRDPQIGREVAIKKLTGNILAEPNMLARFYEEGRRTGRFNHPNIVTVFEIGDEHGEPYIVMECVDGEPLDKILRGGSQTSLADKLEILEKICSALGYAHRENVIHRDVKPANIFVQRDGTAKLLDFGIARLEKREGDLNLTRTGTIVGTIPYMAPERLRNETLDGRSDIFAAGVVLYQILTGKLPFTGLETEIMFKILREPFPLPSTVNPDCPPSLEYIVDRALAKNPDDRYQTAEEMAADLSTAVSELHQEQINQQLPDAQRLIEAEEFAKARTLLLQLLKLDPKHAEVKRLLDMAGRQALQAGRREKIQLGKGDAEKAFEDKHYGKALEILTGLLEVEPENLELTKLRDKVKKAKDKQEKIDELLRQAEVERRKGKYEVAIEILNNAKKVDKTDSRTNSKITAVCNEVIKEAEQARLKAQAKALLKSARTEISARHFSEAIDLLKQVEPLDPTNPELPLLLQDASAGLEQIRRREIISRIEEEVSKAFTYDLLKQASQSIQDAMASMPAEAALFQLNAQVERQIKSHENRILVDETIQKCRDLAPGEALDLIRKALVKLPGEERLMGMEAMLAERFRQQNVDERRSDYLNRAREALNRGEYSDAVKTLEFCEAEGIATGEILSLLDFARNEELEFRRQEVLRNNLAQAQALLGESQFDEAIEFIEGVLQQGDDAALHMLLDQAAAGRESLRQQIETALANARKLTLSGKQADATQLLQMQPPPVQRSVRVQTALAALAEEGQQPLYRMIGRAYAVLETDLPAGEAVMRQATLSANSRFVKSVASSFRSRGRTFADRMIADALSGSKATIKEDKEKAGQLLQSVTSTIDFASPELRTEWLRAMKKMGKSSQTSRFTRV
jgi:serine/threonine-protein kinase